MSYAGSLANVEQWAPIVREAAWQWALPESWVYAVIHVESKGNPDAINTKDPDGSRGLMQISGPTARALGVQNLDDLFDPVYNIGVGSQLLAELHQRFGNDFRRVYSAYNSGDPDLWQSSNQVARNVESALEALSYYQDAPGVQSAALDAGGGSWMILAAAVGLLMVSGKKKGR